MLYEIRKKHLELIKLNFTWAETPGVQGCAAHTLWNWTWRDIFRIVRSR